MYGSSSSSSSSSSIRTVAVPSCRAGPLPDQLVYGGEEGGELWAMVDVLVPALQHHVVDQSQAVLGGECTALVQGT